MNRRMVATISYCLAAGMLATIAGFAVYTTARGWLAIALWVVVGAGTAAVAGVGLEWATRPHDPKEPQ